ncbi:hypothetical protein BS47DRAFT_1393914 [Hydnum rufescens UP504]|uniref:BTB domain-containing protein n=1 Tax=Hydnum rufescens UP504 TaxID=1448309 RepID=A0A9P6DWH1_9AGAM|nr:hypothetical protein BS47DRAFT_1393914 [Hydnum rufescens UP504]
MSGNMPKVVTGQGRDGTPREATGSWLFDPRERPVQQRLFFWDPSGRARRRDETANLGFDASLDHRQEKSPEDKWLIVIYAPNGSSMHSPSHTSEQIQAHLYKSFLNGATSDVSLRCTGSWSAVYALHRVVLIQAGFFRSLFTNGWRESSNNKDTVDTIHLKFDDPNITRAGEHIRVFVWGWSNFISLPRPVVNRGPPVDEILLLDFLLSLLATSTYLNMPAESSHALNLIMQSIGPRTVMRYLDFAIGKGIGDVIEEEPVSRTSSSFSVPHGPNGNGETTMGKFNGVISGEEDPLDDRASTFTIGTHISDSATRQPHFFYGTMSNHIGESCACWLSRWGCDMFQYEEALMDAARTSSGKGAPSSTERFIPYGRHVLVLHPVQDNISSSNYKFERGNHPVIWAPGGLSVRWVRGIISSDGFFVANELERYRFAMRVRRFRRAMIGDVDTRDAKEPEDDQREWDELFQTGIYYSHMSFEELREIEKDRMVPLQTLALAHWTQSVFRGLITARPFSSHSVLASPLARPNSPPSPSHPTPPRELGDNLSSACSTSRLHNNSFPVSPDSPKSLTSNEAKPKKLRQMGDESTFFGMGSGKRTARQAVADDPTGVALWTEFEPFRFSTEWWGVHALKEKAKLNSITVSYGGSWFNVYVQVVRRKGLQLGAYLHRQSMVDPIPLRFGSAWVTRYSPFTGAVSTSLPNPHPHSSSSGSRLASPLSTSTSTSNLRAGLSIHTPYRPTSPSPINAPKVEFRDPRPVVRAYFSITCPSASAWGWKSSTCLEIPVTNSELEGEGDENGEGITPNTPPSDESIARWLREMRSVRSTVMIGLV